MALSQSDAAKMEQIIKEVFPKSLHIILELRTPSSSSLSSTSSRINPRDKWFNLALKECPAVLERLNLCSPEHMVVDVILAEKLLEVSDSPISEVNRMKETVIERWEVRYELEVEKDKVLTTKINTYSVYKKLKLLLRSLYATATLLPAHRVLRQLNLPGHRSSYFLTHRVSLSPEPLSNSHIAEMKGYSFTPVDTCSGRLCISVMYLPKLPDLVPRTSIFMSPKIIKEYIGSSFVSRVKKFCSSFSGTDEGNVISHPRPQTPQKTESDEAMPSCAFDDVDGGQQSRDSDSRHFHISCVGAVVDTLQKAQPLTQDPGKEKITIDVALATLSEFVKLKDSLIIDKDSRKSQSS